MKKRNILFLFSLFVLGLLVVSGAAGMAVYAQTNDNSAQIDDGAQQGTTSAQRVQTASVYDVIVSDPRLSSFELLVNAAALADNLDQAGSFTVFAPTNDAWAAFEAMSGETEATLTQILLYHVANGNYPASAIASRASLTSLLGEPISLSTDNIGARLDDSGRIAAANIPATNGVVHIIDTVLIPPPHSLATSQLGSRNLTMAQVLENDGRFATLLMLLEQAGLMDELRNPNAEHTLFAPTDDAFAALPQDVLDEWMAPGNSQFVGLMAYHLVTDELGINQIATDDLIPTLEGRPIFVTTDERLGVYLNGEPVSDFNIVASNGVIHVVDSVLSP